MTTKYQLAQWADVSLASATAVLTLAMLAFTLYLAKMVPARVDAKVAARADAPVADDVATPARTRKAGGIGVSLTWLAALLLAAAAIMRGVSVGRAPLGNMYEFTIVGSFFLVAAYCVWGLRRDLRWLGVFITAPVVLACMLAQKVWYTEASELVPSLQSYWLVIHVTVATLSIALFGVGFVLSSLYLWLDRVRPEGSAVVESSDADGSVAQAKPRGRMAGLAAKLPAATTIERLSYGVHIVAFPLWTFTLIAGAIWARQAWGAYWNWDPKEVWTFIIWVVYAGYLHARATPTMSRRTANWIAVAGFGCIIFNYAIVNKYLVGMHSYSGL